MKKTLLLITMILATMIAIGCGNTPSNTQAASPEGDATANAAAVDSNALPFSSKQPATDSKGEGKSLLPSRSLPQATAITIPAGTPVTVRLQTAVSSATSHSGDRFDAVLDGPLVIGGNTIAPAGAPASGRVVAASPSGHLEHPGMIQIALTSITVNGKAVPVSSSSVIARGASHKKRNLAMIGGGAGGGALIGGLVGGGKGALIGSAIGAGAGTTTAYATGKKDVGFGVERRLTFRITQTATVSR